MSDESKKGVTAAAGVTGAVVGAGLGAAASYIMTDKKLRNKVKGALTDVSSQVIEVIDRSVGKDQKGGSSSRQSKGASGKKLNQSGK